MYPENKNSDQNNLVPLETVIGANNGFKGIISSNKPRVILAVTMVVALASFGGARVYQNSRNQQTPAANAVSTAQNTEQSKSEAEPAQEVAVPISGPSTTPGTPATEKKLPAPSTQPAPKPAPAPAPAPTPAPANTTNCLPANPSVYQQNYIGMTNSGYLQTNSYSNTNKMYAALEFAGLIGAVNSRQVVVFAPNDYVFDNTLTASQLAWMNQSPENMRSVLGWHIVTGCITYGGVNPVKDLPVGTTMTLTTLNGPVTFTRTDKGKIENAPVAIWDWFTSNGSVTFITDFIKEPQIP